MAEFVKSFLSFVEIKKIHPNPDSDKDWIFAIDFSVKKAIIVLGFFIGKDVLPFIEAIS